MTDDAKLTPIQIIKSMIDTDVTRERVLHPSETDKTMVEFVEKKSLFRIDMTQQDMASIAIEYIESGILHQKEIPCETPPQTDSETSSPEAPSQEQSN